MGQGAAVKYWEHRVGGGSATGLPWVVFSAKKTGDSRADESPGDQLTI
jgi:hypothetical protein